ncbi:protein-L-isoaspartate O-methyltransferase [Fictibacillus phosphorivorans]|uniref:Protein-L-isoaspartate O-methyltransferase n=1 Tax=Fictibacillus phosphorivorans TaxID=1221500 RepID=A0A161TRM2_9BACL|nr:erythromycin esterase family protein [Fictibacillus phosphorivorans]KZE69031.1 protein-L-isoaspartate O-methyltransferase [Fictibacillus phosphorivorans]
MSESMAEYIRKHAIKLEDTHAMDEIVNSIGNARYVMLGEASHGTSEFYTIRAELSKRLIQEKGFSFIAVEGDWPSCYRVNRYIKSYNSNPPELEVLLKQSFTRWPSWMWANKEMLELISWLKRYNDEQSTRNKVGFFGIDLYSLFESMEEIIRYLEENDPDRLQQAKKAFSCFQPFEKDEQEYAISAGYLSESCEDEVIKLLLEIQSKRETHEDDPEGGLSLELNALVAAHAEQYYRSMVKGDTLTWNIRDRHMAEAVEKLMAFHGPEAKVIIWEHNTHIGDARATDMAEEGMINVGQLIREAHESEEVYALGFGTHRGTVIAGNAWGDPYRKISVPPASDESWEAMFHAAGAYDQFILLKEHREKFEDVKGNRAIGVVYDPRYEHLGNYVPTRLSHRYDAFIFINHSHALHPL